MVLLWDTVLLCAFLAPWMAVNLDAVCPIAGCINSMTLFICQLAQMLRVIELTELALPFPLYHLLNSKSQMYFPITFLQRMENHPNFIIDLLLLCT